MTTELDAGKLAAEVASIVKDAAEDYLQGAAEDVEDNANEIAMELTSVLQSGDQQAVGELQAQLLALAEVKRIQLDNSSAATLDKILSVALKFGLAALGAIV